MDVVYTPDAADSEHGQPQNVLDTVDGEIHFFRALMRARPVGVNRHFHVMTMQAAIEKGVGHVVPVQDIWRKLESCYNLEALETLETEYESNANQSDSSTPQPTASPKEGDNLAIHPFFQAEFALPSDPFIESILAERRVRPSDSPTPPASPSPARSASETVGLNRREKRRRPTNEPSKADLAGLVSGDSDSSDLTQQSGDEGDGSTGLAQTPSEKRTASVASGTDGGTDGLEEEEEEKGEDETAPKPRRGRKPGRGRGRGGRKRKR